MSRCSVRAHSTLAPRRSCRQLGGHHGSYAPAPVTDLRHVLAVLAYVEFVTLHGAPVARRRLLYLIAEARNSFYGVQRELISVEIVQNDHVEGGRRRSLLLIATDMDVVVIVPTVGQLVDHRRVAVKGEHHRFVRGEQFIEILIAKTVRMFGLRLKHHQVHHVDDADTDVGNIDSQEPGGSERLEGGYVARASHDYVGITFIA